MILKWRTQRRAVGADPDFADWLAEAAVFARDNRESLTAALSFLATWHERNSRRVMLYRSAQSVLIGDATPDRLTDWLRGALTDLGEAVPA